MKKFLSLTIRIIIGLSILAFLIYKLDFTKVYQTILAISFLIILFLLLKYFVFIFINALNIKILLNSLRLRIRFLTLLRYSLLSYSIGQFSLGRAGEFSLAYFLNKKKIYYGESTAVLVVDKIISIIALTAISIIGFFLFFSNLQAIKITLILIGFIALVCFSLYSSKVRNFFKRRILRKYSSNFKGFSRNIIYLLRKKKRFLLLDLILTFVNILLGAFILYIIFLFLDIKVPYFLVPTISAIGIVSSLIPISISGLGVRESLIVYLYSQLNINPVIIGSIYLITIFINYIIAIIILFPFIIKGKFLRDINLKNIFEKENKEAL